MANIARQPQPFLDFFKGETHAELSGLNPMDVPTTQIRITPGGVWHRRGPEDERTACGLAYSSCAIRAYVGHKPDLCAECFTRHEREVRPST